MNTNKILRIAMVSAILCVSSASTIVYAGDQEGAEANDRAVENAQKGGSIWETMRENGNAATEASKEE